MQKIYKEKAFSLIEVLIAVAIITLIAFGGFYFSKNKEKRQGEIIVPRNDLDRIRALNKAKKDIGEINKNIKEEEKILE
jgi:prepilin-type N-terminal cleavage/methylation domain-containing protein